MGNVESGLRTACGCFPGPTELRKDGTARSTIATDSPPNSPPPLPPPPGNSEVRRVRGSSQSNVALRLELQRALSRVDELAEQLEGSESARLRAVSDRKRLQHRLARGLLEQKPSSRSRQASKRDCESASHVSGGTAISECFQRDAALEEEEMRLERLSTDRPAEPTRDPTIRTIVSEGEEDEDTTDFDWLQSLGHRTCSSSLSHRDAVERKLDLLQRSNDQLLRKQGTLSARRVSGGDGDGAQASKKDPLAEEEEVTVPLVNGGRIPQAVFDEL